jgi:hypothetical protein
VALSTTKVGYMTTTHACKDTIWLQIFFSGIRLVQQEIRLYYNSQSAIFLEKNPTYHSKTNHIHVQCNFVRDMFEDKKVFMEKVDTLNNVVDSLTKLVCSEKLSWCRETMGITTLDC